MKEDLCTARPNYEALYEKLATEHKMLCNEFSMVVKEKEALETEVAVLKAQLDIVHLIFSK